MTLHLIRLGLRLAALAEWSARRDLMPVGGFDQGRALHHLLGETFGPGALQPFRLLAAPGGHEANLYGYSAADLETLRETARSIALPDALAVLPLSGLEAKPMPDAWRSGQRVGFDVRVRPVVRLASPVPAHADAHGRPQPARRAGAETDAFLARILRAGVGEVTPPREAVYAAWLAERLAPAARLTETRLTRFERTRAARSGVTDGPDATLQGTLEIAASETFSDLLARGVGRHRAYGYGMLLLRAPGRPAPDR
jgi:CRISPR system Cascade subunit CasE